jgi:DNA polymerase-3 subunit alpha
MDFLGLKTLTIIKDAINSIKIRTGNKIDIENIPLDDKLTFELFKKGNTIGIFQFESDGMRTYLKSLKPTNIEDLIAMNALFRPGPMDHIPSFINRKHGKEKINYPHPILEEILKPTYGVMVYQEQIMQISQRMAAFSGSEADELRKAMGKKKKEDIEKLSRKFIMGSVNNNIDQKKAEEIYEMMAKFGQYGFNRSHAAAYSVIAYQTAFLKAHYPADFMAAILTNNINDIKSITFYLSECKRHNIVVLGPDINESNIKFTVNSKGEIRFGLAAVKNVGEGVVSDIIAERETNGYYKDVFDLAKRVNVRSLNKKCLESLVLAGAFDSFPATHRAQYFFRENPEDVFFLEKIIRNASSFQNGKLQNQVSLFGDCLENELPELQLPDCEPWSKFELLQKEKEIVGFFISGHPLDEFSLEMANFCNSSISEIKTSDDLKKIRNREVRFAGIVSASAERFTKKGDKYVSFTIEDYNDSMSFNLFKEDFLKFNHFLLPGQILYFKARIQSRFNADDQYELRISAMCLLSEVIEKYAKSVSVMIPLSDINDDVIGKLNGIVTSSKGNCPFKIIVSDDTENCSIELISSKNKINISDFTKLISRLSDLEFKVS